MTNMKEDTETTDAQYGGVGLALVAALVAVLGVAALAGGASAAGSDVVLDTNLTLDDGEDVVVDYNVTGSSTANVTLYGYNDSVENRTQLDQRVDVSGDGLVEFNVTSQDTYSTHQVVVESTESNVSSVEASIAYTPSGGGGGGGLGALAPDWFAGVDSWVLIVASVLGLLAAGRWLS
jgi:hypothetical protein